MLFRRRTFQSMGSPCEVQVFAGSDRQLGLACSKVVADVDRLDARYSNYRGDSFLSQINAVAAKGGAIEVDAETAALLDYAQACYEQSGGLFDVTCGALRRAWRFDRGELPDQKLIDALLPRVGWTKLRWSRPMLEFPTPGMELDFGGIVKEYAADRAAVLCHEAGVFHGAVNLGGDIRIVGPRPDGEPWGIGIRDPRRPETAPRTLLIGEGALATSGDYERCIIVDGVRYGHVLNPRTGWPVTGLASVSVVADLCVVAGSATTIAMLHEQAGPAWLEALGSPCLWISLTGEVGGSLAASSAAGD